MLSTESNGIPLLAVVIELLVTLSISTIALLLWQKYRQRGDNSIKNLFFGVFFYSLAVFVSWIGKVLEYFLPFDIALRNYSGFMIIVAYCCTILANAFVIVFYSAIFEGEESSYTKKLLFLDGITLGFILPNISFDEHVYDKILYFLVYHIIISFIIYGNLYRKSKAEERNAEDPISKTGFKFIGLFGLAVIALYVSFVLDLIVGIIQGGGYTPFYYLGWISGGFASLFAYLGYIMPNWLRNRVSKN